MGGDGRAASRVPSATPRSSSTDPTRPRSAAPLRATPPSCAAPPRRRRAAGAPRAPSAAAAAGTPALVTDAALDWAPGSPGRSWPRRGRRGGGPGPARADRRRLGRDGHDGRVLGRRLRPGVPRRGPAAAAPRRARLRRRARAAAGLLHRRARRRAAAARSRSTGRRCSTSTSSSWPSATSTSAWRTGGSLWQRDGALDRALAPCRGGLAARQTRSGSRTGSGSGSTTGRRRPAAARCSSATTCWPRCAATCSAR